MSRRFQRDKELIDNLVASENYLKTRAINNIFGPHFTKLTDGQPNPVETVVAQGGITRIRGADKVISPVSYLPFDLSSGDSQMSNQEKQADTKLKAHQFRTRQAPTRQTDSEPVVVQSDSKPELPDQIQQSTYEYNRKQFENDQILEVADQVMDESVKQHKEKLEKLANEKINSDVEGHSFPDVTIEEIKIKQDPEKVHEEKVKETLKLENEELSAKKESPEGDVDKDTPFDDDDEFSAEDDEVVISDHGHEVKLSEKNNNIIYYDNGNRSFRYSTIQVIHEDGDIKSIRFIKRNEKTNKEEYIELEPPEDLNEKRRSRLSEKIISLYTNPRELRNLRELDNLKSFRKTIRNLFTKDSKLKKSPTTQPIESKNVYHMGRGMIFMEDQILPELVKSLGSLQAGNVGEEITNRIVFLSQQAYERKLISKAQYTGLMNSLIK